MVKQSRQHILKKLTGIGFQCSLIYLAKMPPSRYYEAGNPYGDHYLYICDVNQVFADENEEALFAWNGYGKIATAKQGE